MSAVIAVTSTVPVLVSPSLQATQLTQMVMGEAASVIERDGAMLRVRTMLDQCQGWVHAGYLHEVDQGAADAWLATAAWSEGAAVEVGDTRLRVPHRGRLQLEGKRRVRLPDGRTAKIVAGSIRNPGEVFRAAASVNPAQWAWREFGGTPFLWGGVTTAGIDCSGLVQVTFALRGVPLPRDPEGQSRFGETVAAGQAREGDLIFCRRRDGEEVGHVLIHAGNDMLVHATVHTGQVSLESRHGNERMAALLARVETTRRLA